MKKSVVLILAVISACTIGASSAMLLQTPPEKENAVKYVLRDNGGKLALYDMVSNQIQAQYDIYTQLLPQNDVMALRYGIEIKSQAQLNSLLEDFGV